MTGTAKAFKWIAFALMAGFGLLFGMFAAGYAFEDPGGWAGVGLVALWFVPAVVLSVFALRRPAPAGRAFVWATAIIAVLTLADSMFGIIPRSQLGPLFAIAVGAAGVVLAFLGLHQPKLAGTLMVVLGLAQIVAAVLSHSSSSAVVVAPILLAGLLFLLSGSLDHESLHRPSELAG